MALPPPRSTIASPTTSTEIFDPNGAGGASLFPDHFAHVSLGDAHLNARGSVALNLAHVNCFRFIDESFDDHFDGVAHIQSPW